MKTITADDRLKVLGLLTIAKEHTIEARKFELAILRMLDLEDGSHFSDVLWGFDGPISVAELDGLLEKSEIEIAE